jgi:hypothetical protein
MTGVAELHAQALDVTGRIVTGIPAGRWHAATPCAGWDARALLNHVVWPCSAAANDPSGSYRPAVGHGLAHLLGYRPGELRVGLGAEGVVSNSRVRVSG